MVVVVVFFSSRTPPDEDLMKALTILHPALSPHTMHNPSKRIQNQN